MPLPSPPRNAASARPLWRRAAAAGLLALTVLAAGPAPAAPVEVPRALSAGSTGRAVEIVDGDTLLLADGREVRLVGLQAPKLPLGRPDFTPWPLAGEAKAALAKLALAEELLLAYGGRRMDRHGRQLAHLYRTRDGAWLQAALLARGLARVYSFADNRALVGDLLAIERRARAAGRGIWAHPYYAVRTPETVADDVGSFQLVEGRVEDAAVVRGRAYLNFGRDWRTDFTVTLAPEVRRLFESEGIDPRDYQGRRVRVRGWITEYNGPMIEATHPEQIEVLQP